MATTTVLLDGIDVALQQKATRIFEEEGLTASDVYRRLLLRTVEAKHLPLDLFSPSAETMEAMEEARRGNLKSYDNIEALMTELDADD